MAQEGNMKPIDVVDGESSKKSEPKKKTPKSKRPLFKKKSVMKSTSNARNSEVASSVNANKEENKKDLRDESNREKIDGMIFMCNAKTKSDCFRYMVMGLPENKKNNVEAIKPGVKLFLFDFDAELLYGIFKATSVGGMKLEPAAFGGSYPAQVRFKVDMDCLPLSEGSFRKAITGHSGGDKVKFNPILTAQQVKKLTSLFQSSSSLHSPQPVHRLFEEISARAQDEPARIQMSTVPLNPLSFGEKEYRLYGLRPRAIPTPIPSYESYLSKSESETNLSPRRTVENEYKRQAYYDHYDSYGDTSHLAHAANALSDYNRSHQQQLSDERGDYGSLPVSSRYSFAGPSFSYQ